MADGARREPWFAMPDAVFDAGLDPFAFCVLAFLYRHADKGGASFWSRAKMAAACKMSPRQLTRALGSLRPDWVTWEQRHAPNGGWSANRYTVVRPVEFATPLRPTRPKVVAGQTASAQLDPWACQANPLRPTRPTKDLNFPEGQREETVPPALDLSGSQDLKI
jgi:hypothetical protein